MNFRTSFNIPNTGSTDSCIRMMWVMQHG